MLLEMMGGSISVRSEYGKGSTFTILLPQVVLSDEPVGDFEEKFENALEGKKSYHESFRAPTAKVLIVDDTRMNLIVVTEFLKETLIKIDTAGGGKEALKLALANKYDVILMDQRMPEMDGVQTLQEIRKHKEGPNIETPVICLTADAVVGARNRYLSKGFNDYLTKPIDSIYLEAMLKKYIPDDKIEAVEYIEDNTPKTSSSEDQIFDKLRKAGVDTAVGIANCTGEDFYRTILAEYLNSSPGKTAGLNEALENENYNNYGVIIHSLKSTSATIGAADLSRLAQKLEKASNERDISYIRNEHDAFMDKYNQLLDVIRELVPQDEGGTGPDDDDGDILEFAPEP
jgi:CheY-like chemotaxis protein